VARRRPNLNQAIRALLEDVVIRLPEFRHIRPERILVVTGEARRASRGSIKPLTFAQGKSKDLLGHRKPVVRMDGKRMLYCITLRPLFFRKSTARDRIQTLLHELFHVAPAFDGTLDEDHRHARLGADFYRTLRPLVRRYLKRCPKELLAPFSYDGEVRVSQWLERPGAYYMSGRGKVRRLYTEDQLFLATVRMVTRDGGSSSHGLE
jgi:predicted metallopeptidase